MTLYPLLMAPNYRKTAWGGDMLRDAFMKDAPAQTGESLEISALEGCESIIKNGEFAGTNLRRLAETLGSDLTGSGADIDLMLKLIDANDVPDEQRGGSRAWVILNCDADSEIVCGDAAQKLKVRPGDVYYVPDGQMSAIGAGIQAYEISYTGASDGARHDNAQFNKLYGATALCKGGSRTYYACDAHFELSRLNISGKMPIDDERMLMLMPLGYCTLIRGDEELELLPFESIVIPAGLKDVSIRSEDCKVLLSAPSNRDALRAELGYRAENVAGLVD